MGTVKGDVHDIGKNLVNIMLEGAGFTVHDLGVNVAPEVFIEAINEHKPDIVGFSAFLTTTMPMFKANINALEKAGIRDDVIVMVGGAPVTQEYADKVGADGYAADASTAVRLAKDLIEKKRSAVPAVMGPLALVEAAVKKPIWGCQMCGQCVLHSTGHDVPDELPEDAPQRAVRRRAPGRALRGEARDALRLGEGRRARAEDAVGARDPRPAAARRQPPLGHVVVAQLPHEARQADAEGLACRGLRTPSTAGRFVVTAELLTVNAGGLDAVHERFAPYEDYVDATNATDNTSAHAHASPLAVAIALKQLGMEPVMQLTCRDRNRLALEAEIAGAALHGIENICCLTGDDVTAGDEPEARRVFDLDSIQLLALGASMAQGTYLSGREDRPGAEALPRRGREPRRAAVRLPRRARAGRRCARARASSSSRSASSRERLAAFMHEAVEQGARRRACALIPSICLVRSPSALRYMDENVPGISVPAETIERCERARRSGAGVLRGRLRARRARALAARRRRPAPDQLPPRGRHRRGSAAARHSDPRRKGDEWIPSSSRGLRPSSSVRSSRSA